jgi:hypothetical protein
MVAIIFIRPPQSGHPLGWNPKVRLSSSAHSRPRIRRRLQLRESELVSCLPEVCASGSSASAGLTSVATGTTRLRCDDADANTPWYFTRCVPGRGARGACEDQVPYEMYRSCCGCPTRINPSRSFTSAPMPNEIRPRAHRLDAEPPASSRSGGLDEFKDKIALIRLPCARFAQGSRTCAEPAWKIGKRRKASRWLVDLLGRLLFLSPLRMFGMSRLRVRSEPV